MVEMLAELPDLWDVNIRMENDSASSRFEMEGYQEQYISFVKSTSKPVVGVDVHLSRHNGLPDSAWCGHDRSCKAINCRSVFTKEN